MNPVTLASVLLSSCCLLVGAVHAEPPDIRAVVSAGFDTSGRSESPDNHVGVAYRRAAHLTAGLEWEMANGYFIPELGALASIGNSTGGDPEYRDAIHSTDTLVAGYVAATFQFAPRAWPVRPFADVGFEMGSWARSYTSLLHMGLKFELGVRLFDASSWQLVLAFGTFQPISGLGMPSLRARAGLVIPF